MPNYTYNCTNCGEFTLRQSMNVQHDTAKCPTCDAESIRVFNSFQTYRMDGKLKKRIERGQEPRLVKRDQLPQIKPKANRTARPWMAGH
ncbi:zinc ribbon domain-containing protein [Staphylococcus sp. NRL 16/872]|uniref:FmdB family zinc ribbon protein n=1 Tax=Staphylococcus sp. NRL 16/872 TaxID=2930131 RepID=UPI001FB4120E|nr:MULTISPECIES: zinc ribbon domain-containing protein [unclassified Staphylococcus]MCJ1655312.1 zinc ribbon domain-containing protein [Staphylococcus sp. NRL 21/187]MCJ1661148.1 zinc ribbon domain-containing protein [Staphylococcus sp. NRL 18/288]MCJ1667041.1 zinc ribbon domain-containing protein [Staphylococcus sp. NRL 19/737]WEN69516.1 zinc ribbon domain-containing protein [Staphylococcus sp. NRL 16/872]